ncbi:OprO/OprP family phosphate-selective porin [Myxococcota bacterium]|nr:OprO/OprP family phosphate-selective porin [Myxococcota bacterium]MBU1537631.1 OprO/OprP family phosphate-selective porin [Myxococcota bacterium]
MKWFSACFTVMMALFSLSAFGQTVKIKGEYHGNLNLDLTDNGHDGTEAAFQTTRMYVTAEAALNKMFSFRTTLDFGNFTGDATGLENPLFGYIKYAYVQIEPMKGLKLRFGQQATPWIGAMDNVMGYRYVYKTGLDYFKLGDSADTGFSVLGEAMDGIIAYQAGVFNGVGYKTAAEGETLPNLKVMGRLSVYPMATQKNSPLSRMGLHLYGETDAIEEGDDTVRGMMYGAALSFNHKYVDFLVEFMMRSSDADGDGGGMILAPYLKLKYEQWSAFATYSMYKEDGADDTWTRIIAGGTWDYSKKFALSLNYQMVTSKKHTSDSDTSGIFLNVLAKF